MSDNDKPTCSICGGEGAVTAFGSYESADGTQPCQACSGTGEREETAIDEFIENAIKAKQEARRLAERCRLLEKHIWHDVYRVAKESGEFDDDAEAFANKAIELLNCAINEEIGGEAQATRPEPVERADGMPICTGALSANAHHWREIDSQSNTASRTDVRCVRCGVFGEMDNNTRDITFPTT